MIKFKNKIILDIKNIEKAEKKNIYKAFKESIDNSVQDAIVSLIIKGHIDKGVLLDSFYITKISDSKYIVGNSAKYAGILERGAPSHKIEAVNAPALVFWAYPKKTSRTMRSFEFIRNQLGESSGKHLVVIPRGQSVNHPGVKAEWFLLNAIKQNMKKFEKKFS